jgi:hypothetical protein
MSTKTNNARALELVATIARMNFDGEEMEDGEVFEMENDDTHETLVSLIYQAREIMAQ